MAYFEVTKEIEFDYGHRIANHASKCRSIHGHRAKVQVTVQGRLNAASGASDFDMVMDFGEIKTILVEHVHDVFDHVLILDKADPCVPNLIGELLRYMPPDDKPNCWPGNRVSPSTGTIQLVDGPPTAENLAFIIYNRLSLLIDSGMLDRYVMSVKFFETPTSMAECRRLVKLKTKHVAAVDPDIPVVIGAIGILDFTGIKPLSYSGCVFRYCDHFEVCRERGCLHPSAE